jgi:DNA replication protein DnaC
MNKKINEILKKTAENMSKANTQNSSITDSNLPRETKALPGDPNCPKCHGLGYYRLEVPVDHPSFGKVFVCDCRLGEVSHQIREKLFSMSHLENLQHLTFDNFKPRGRVGSLPYQAESLERAYNQAVQFAEKREGWLILEGAYGCGKTHLAAAIANFAVESGIPTLFITVPDMLDSLRFSYNNPDTTFEQRFEEIRTAPLLILDDFGTENATPWAQEKLFQIINYRYTNKLPTIITTNIPLDQLEGRIHSRLADPDLVTQVHISSSDYRQPANDLGQNELSSLYLYRNRTFASFSLRKDENLSKESITNLEKALQTAQTYAKDPNGWLTLTGSYGNGKTHLAAAIANYCADLGSPPLFIVVPDLLGIGTGDSDNAYYNNNMDIWLFLLLLVTVLTFLLNYLLDPLIYL